MLIGISGKIGSGKDTVAKIMQFLIFRDKLKKQGKELVGSNDVHWSVFSKWSDAQREQWSGYSIEKYDGALKDMVCRMLACTREQLEDPVFKNTELPEDWWYYETSKNPRIILPRGYFPEESDNLLCENRYLVKPTPRLILQNMGTEGMREQVHPNFWVNALFSGYKRMSHSGSTRDMKFPNWIITDVRFPNELKAIEERGGIPIRISRTGIHTPKPEDLHPSETSLDNASFKYYINNDGTLEDLIKKVHEILILENIIL